jgi:hypothetical protein
LRRPRSPDFAEEDLIDAVGGGYIFMHRLPMEHIASLGGEQGIAGRLDKMQMPTTARG